MDGLSPLSDRLAPVDTVRVRLRIGQETKSTAAFGVIGGDRHAVRSPARGKKDCAQRRIALNAT